MENYVKCVKGEVNLEPPFPDELRDNVPVMVFKSFTRIRNVLSYAEKHFKDVTNRSIIFHGADDAVGKCISSVEVFKRCNEHLTLYQWNRITFVRRSDLWKSSESGKPDLIMRSDVPAIFILVSKNPFPGQYECESMQTSTQTFPNFESLPSAIRTTKPLSKRRGAFKKRISDSKWVKSRKCDKKVSILK